MSLTGILALNHTVSVLKNAFGTATHTVKDPYAKFVSITTLSALLQVTWKIGLNAWSPSTNASLTANLVLRWRSSPASNVSQTTSHA